MALGRGLGEILSEVEKAYEKDLSDIESLEPEKAGAQIEEIPVDAVSPNPFQPRKQFDERALEELSRSIKTHGLLQPIVVVEKEGGYLLVAGERRLKAHKLAGFDTIKAIVAPVEIDDFRMRELALIENIQRENLNAIELAKAYAELIEVHNITHEELARIVHKSRSQITNTLRLLSLTPYIQDKVAEGKLTQGHAKVLIGLDEKTQKIVADSIVGQKLSVRDAEALAQRYKKSATQSQRSRKESLKNITADYADRLKKYLPFRHSLKADKIEIRFASKQEVEEFLSFFENR